MRYKIFLGCALICMSFILGDCHADNAAEPQVNKDSLLETYRKDITIPGGFTAPTKIVFDSTAIALFLDSFPALKNQQTDIKRFYQRRNFSYAWFDGKGLIEQADNLLNKIRNMNEDGVTTAPPYADRLEALLENSQSMKPSLTLELMLTAQYLTYAKNVWAGMSEQQSLALKWFLPRGKVSYQQLLDSLLAGKNILDNSPLYPQYDLLKKQLKIYTDIKNKGGWPVVSSSKKSYRQGDSASAIVAIRKCLFLMDDITTDNGSAIFDAALTNGVKKMQHRFGYKEDGIVGTKLIDEINYPVQKRIEQIMVNMERSRWLPEKIGKNYFVINIPEFKLHIYENDTLAWSMKVVVGKSQHQTVVFNGELKYIVFSPYWNVPSSILHNEILPAMRRNRYYLARHHMEWNGGSVRQRPGPDNALGLVKFLFPNSHNIYMHDTPTKSLFNEDKRAFSHGCIRLAEARKLALYLLKDDPEWDDIKIDSAMNSGVEQFVTLKNRTPVYITYFTAWVNEAGELCFRNDIYQRDSRLAAILLEKPAL